MLHTFSGGRRSPSPVILAFPVALPVFRIRMKLRRVRSHWSKQGQSASHPPDGMNCDLLGTVAGIETGLDLELTRILHPCSQGGARNISFPRCSQHRPT